MLLNLFVQLMVDYASGNNYQKSQAIIDTLLYDFEKINHKIYRDDTGRIFVVQKNAAATAVADIVEPDLGNAIIRYNHHLLKGNIEEKKAILKKIADALEPKRPDLKNANKTIENDFFYMVNSMNGYDVASSSGLIGMEMQGAMAIFAVNLKRIIKLMGEK